MTNYIKHPFLDKIISFIISLIIVLIIFVGIVGIVFPLMVQSTNIESVKVISLISTLIGALIIILARRWSLIRFVSFIKDTVEYDTKAYDFIGSLIIGLSFVVAGVLYMRTKNPNMMIIPFIAGAALIRIIIFYINNQIKKQDLVSPQKKKEQ